MTMLSNCGRLTARIAGFVCVVFTFSVPAAETPAPPPKELLDLSLEPPLIDTHSITVRR